MSRKVEPLSVALERLIRARGYEGAVVICVTKEMYCQPECIHIGSCGLTRQGIETALCSAIYGNRATDPMQLEPEGYSENAETIIFKDN
jgi:hypothetical protein